MLKKIKENIVSIVAILASLIALSAYGGDFVLYASRDTHTAITSDIAILLEDRLSRLKKEIYIARSEETKFKRAGQQVPDWLIREIIRLQTEIRKLEN